MCFIPGFRDIAWISDPTAMLQLVRAPRHEDFRHDLKNEYANSIAVSRELAMKVDMSPTAPACLVASSARA
jgi:hypothetical protein